MRPLKLSASPNRALSLFLLCLSLQTAQAISVSCAERVRSYVNFRTLEEQSHATIRQADKVAAPYWLEAALPDGAEWIREPLAEHAPDRVTKEMGPFVGIQMTMDLDGHSYTTNVGLWADALADNVLRFQEGKPKLVTPEGVRATGVFTHGGGVDTAGFSNGYNAAVHFWKRFIAVVSFDWFGHGKNRTAPTDPSVQYRFIPEFMRRFMPKDKPSVGIGHSMGGQVNDIMMSRLTPELLSTEYDGVPLSGFVMLSPPPDPTRGGNLWIKITRDRESDPETQAKFFEGNKVNLESQAVMADLAFLQNWNNELLETPMQKGFWGMGDADDVCWKNVEAAHREFAMARAGVTSRLFTDGELVNDQKKPIAADHMFVKGRRDPRTFPTFGEGEVDSFADSMGHSIPWIYAESLQFVEREILGHKDFDPFDSTKSADLTKPEQITEATQAERLGISIEEVQAINAKNAYRKQLADVLELFAKNTVFREFLKNFNFQGRVPKNEAKLKIYNKFLNQLETFTSELGVFKRQLKNSKVPFLHTAEWTTFFNWMKQGPEERKANLEMQSLMAVWTKGDQRPAVEFALQLIRHMEGKNPFGDVRATLGELPINLETILANLQSGTDLPKTLEILDQQKTVLVGIRDVDIVALAALDPKLKDVQKEVKRLSDKYRDLVDSRRRKVLPELVVFFAQLLQTQNLFTKFTAAEMAEHGQRLRQFLADTPALDPNLNFGQAKAAFGELQTAGWQDFAFESLSGPDMRVRFSTLDRIIKEIARESKADKIAKLEGNFVEAWKSLSGELEKVRGRMEGSMEITSVARGRIQLAEASLEVKKQNALGILTRFFHLRENFIRENHHRWTETSRPEYPAEYFQLMQEYKAAQVDYQKARQALEAEKKKLSLEGEMGVYMKMLYENLDEIEAGILRVNGRSKDDVGSLTAIEYEIQTIEHQMEDIQAGMLQPSPGIARPSSVFYNPHVFSGWDVLNDPDNPPTSADLNRIFQAWNRIWRDPTGGAVQDTSGY